MGWEGRLEERREEKRGREEENDRMGREVREEKVIK